MSYHHGDLKTALVDAAIRLLKEKGVEALSLRTIAADVGVSHMAPYAHFKNKTELFQSIAAYGFNAMADRMDEIDETQLPDELILSYGAEYIAFALDNAPLYRLMLSQTQVMGPQMPSQSAEHMTGELRQASSRPFVLLRNAFAKLIDDKDLQSIRAQGAWAMVHGMAALIIDGHLNVPEGMTIKNYLAQAVPRSTRLSNI